MLPRQPKQSLRHDKQPNSEGAIPVHYEPNETHTAILRSSLQENELKNKQICKTIQNYTEQSAS